MAAVTITAVETNKNPTFKKTDFQPEFQIQVESNSVVSLAEFVDPITNNVNPNYSVLSMAGSANKIVCKLTFAQLQALFPMT